MVLRVAQIVPQTEAEGPGRRFALWVQGCALKCPGCCNPEMFGFDGGREESVEGVVEKVLRTPGIEGVSFLGGEPSSQAAALGEIARRVREAGLSVMVYSGHTLAELNAMGEDVAALLAATDLLVDGRYDREKPEPKGGRRWIGSSNQVMHFFTDRYDVKDPIFTSANTVEIRLVAGELVVNGWPSTARKLIGKR